MTRALVSLDASDPTRVLIALRAALTADGPAVFPRPIPGRDLSPLPYNVHQRIAVVIGTSGSSGRPKRVALTADALLASAAASDTALGGPGQWLLALPAHYIAGVNVLVRSITAQTEPVLLPPGRFDVDAFVAAAAGMDGERAFTSLVPVQLARLTAAAFDDAAVRAVLRRFDRILVGGQAIPAEQLEHATDLGLNVTRTYGSSETSGGCVYDGAPIGTASVRIHRGQIEISGPMLAEGYLDDPDRTSRAFVVDDSHRWYRTGDEGRLVDGNLWVTGRLDRVIVSGGIKVSLDEVERVVRAMPGLSDAVALPVDSAEWGETPAIVTAGGAALETVRSAVVEQLGRAAAPSRIIVVDNIPQLPSGKPDRDTLRTLISDPHSRH